MRARHLLTPRGLRPITLAVAAAVLAARGPLLAQAEPAPSPPDVVADEFNRGFQSMAWAGLVQRLHPEGLANLRLAADILVRVDTTGYVLGALLGDVDPGSYASLPDDEVVRRLLAGIQTEVPGLLSSLVSRRTWILGTVAEGDDRHVVYRIHAQVTGAEPEIRVMTLRRHEGRWRVIEAEDLSVLHTAIRGIPIPGGDPPETLARRGRGGFPSGVTHRAVGRPSGARGR